MNDMEKSEKSEGNRGEEVWLTTTQAAALLPHVSRRSIQHWAAAGEIPGAIQLPSGRYRIPKSAIEELLEKGRLA
ncbi:TPA: helix-turn-helix domain-containing protein [Corynebacterium striatum]|nr:helix-turn-helix domain-containing protein [Corynebacterium striatum]HAT6564285.1 helix-turn-helix domain-containing protein [Corynebacterium striatum]HAT6569747.1 helix-turn-helix domain-containing protein [Corynebacterium striatum]